MMNVDEACKRELSALFAHIAYETGDKSGFNKGLKHLEDESCMYGGAACVNDEEDGKYPATSGKNYYARGPLGVKGSIQYGMFGDSFGPISYMGKQRFLNDPDEVLEDSYTAFAFAI